jgi:FAD/FMN-containing dehydrogenase
LPVDSPSNAATVGGILAVHHSGPLRYGYGTLRDFTIGMQFVTGEGKIVKTGGRVVKNVAGYNLARLLIGSLGTLGIITHANFRTFPIPPETATFVVGFDSLEAALEMRGKIVHSVLQPRALDLVDREAARALRGGMAEIEQSAWSLLVGVGGEEAFVSRHAAEIGKLARESGASRFVELTGEEEAGMWESVRTFQKRLAAHYGSTAVVRAALPLTELGPWVKNAQEIAARSGLSLGVVARAGTAVGYACLLAHEANRETVARMAQACTELIDGAIRLGGRAMIEYVSADLLELKRQVHVWGVTGPDFTLMQKLKREFDPDGVLNPGRYVGGI